MSFSSSASTTRWNKHWARQRNLQSVFKRISCELSTRKREKKHSKHPEGSVIFNSHVVTLLFILAVLLPPKWNGDFDIFFASWVAISDCRPSSEESVIMINLIYCHLRSMVSYIFILRENSVLALHWCFFYFSILRWFSRGDICDSYSNEIKKSYIMKLLP